MNSMMIAVATTDGHSVCDHLARSSAFVVLKLEDGKITSRSTRQRGADECGNHKTFVDLLDGCNAVICGGIGQGAADSLAAHAIAAIVASGRHSVDDAVDLYLTGKLVTTTDRVCLCH